MTSRLVPRSRGCCPTERCTTAASCRSVASSRSRALRRAVRRRGIRCALPGGVPPIDGFYPLVSLAAFLSGGCFGFYAAWRGYARRRAQIHELPREPRDLGKVDTWAA